MVVTPMNKAMTFLQRASNGKVVLILFILTNLVFCAMLVYSIPLVLSFAPESILFDMSPTGYSYPQAVELLQALGIEGRQTYLFVQLPIDFVYPAMFAISYALLITWVLKQIVSSDSRLFLFAFIPVMVGLFDYLENACIIIMINNFPNLPENIVTISSFLTMAKSGLTTLFFIILLTALAFLSTRRLMKNRALTGNKD
jgi:hypothetical protein